MEATLVGNSLAIALKLPVRKAELPQASNILKHYIHIMLKVGLLFFSSSIVSFFSMFKSFQRFAKVYKQSE